MISSLKTLTERVVGYSRSKRAGEGASPETRIPMKITPELRTERLYAD